MSLFNLNDYIHERVRHIQSITTTFISPPHINILISFHISAQMQLISISLFFKLSNYGAMYLPYHADVVVASHLLPQSRGQVRCVVGTSREPQKWTVRGE
jgi:hypothetical protein